MAGRKKRFDDFKKEKFKAVLLYILGKCSGRPTFGKTVLYKLLYFVDFDFYELYERSLTGETYRRIKRGPAPCHFEAITKEMKKNKMIQKLKVPSGDFKQIRYIPNVSADIKILDSIDIKVIDDVINRYAFLTAQKISAISHEDTPCKVTKEGQIIDYELVFYRLPPYSVREYPDEYKKI